MFNRIKKIMPTGILAVGLLVFCLLLLFLSRLESLPFSYDSFLLSEQVREISIAVLVECVVGAALFSFSVKKEKSEDRDSGQKL